ncbi:MAG: ribonuclease HI family protein [Spirochaetia bacterium]|nr:ribonuclease HI family protein [Spirochaetia bacterium]
MSYTVFTDGASRGNPGPAAIGAVCFLNTIPDLVEFKSGFQPVFSISEAVGVKTNNEAEYLSVMAALKKLLAHDIRKAQIFMDSELVIRQINGQYKVKNLNLEKLWIQVKALSRGGEYMFSHIPREKNAIADYLANQAYK